MYVKDVTKIQPNGVLHPSSHWLLFTCASWRLKCGGFYPPCSRYEWCKSTRTFKPWPLFVKYILAGLRARKYIKPLPCCHSHCRVEPQPISENQCPFTSYPTQGSKYSVLCSKYGSRLAKSPAPSILTIAASTLQYVVFSHFINFVHPVYVQGLSTSSH